MLVDLYCKKSGLFFTSDALCGAAAVQWESWVMGIRVGQFSFFYHWELLLSFFVILTNWKLTEQKAKILQNLKILALLKKLRVLPSIQSIFNFFFFSFFIYEFYDLKQDYIWKIIIQLFYIGVSKLWSQARKIQQIKKLKQYKLIACNGQPQCNLNFWFKKKV